MKQILLNSAKNTTDVNVESSEYIELSTKQRAIPIENTYGTINHYELYLKERDECKNYKMTFCLRPYMTNVLFNAFTEVVYNEGAVNSGIIKPKGSMETSHKALFNTQYGNTLSKKALLGENMKYPSNEKDSDFGIDRRYQLIRDTEYSHKDLGNLTYHCGIDIFNNHYLRSLGFFRIRKGEKAKGSKVSGVNNNNEVFNTIKDYMVYGNGYIAEHNREMPGVELKNASGNTTDLGLIDYQSKNAQRFSHLFNEDNLQTLFDAFSNGIKEDNGWVGFNNRAYLPEKNINNNVVINKCLNNREACEFVDFYPDRSLFSLIPKINENFGGREEYNWKWCLTYPFENTNRDSNNVSFDFFNNNGLKIIWNSRTILYDNNDNVIFGGSGKSVIKDDNFVYFRTKCKHNLKTNDTVKITFNNGDFSAKVMGVGDENLEQEKYYFFISYDDIADELGEKKTLINGYNVFYIDIPDDLYVSKVVDGMPCSYYVRKFKKIPNTISTLNRMAFSKTIFNDNIMQVIFDENVNVSGLKDNLGREVSEIYFTLLKTNNGWDKYYLNGITSPSAIEYSHCFGKVTSGFNFECSVNDTKNINPVKNFTDESSYFQKYNVRSLYNIENINDSDKAAFCSVMGIKYIPPTSIENNISEENDVFYGDFVEFSPSTVTETVIEDVYHRFNTAQREIILNNEYFRFDKFRYDEIEFDDFSFNFEDTGNEIASEISDIPEFSIRINNNGFRQQKTNGVAEVVADNIETSDNIFPEGYFYKPHYPVKLKEYSDIVSFDYDVLLLRGAEIKITPTNKIWRYSFKTKENYAFTNEDKVLFYYSDGSYVEYYIYDGTNSNEVVFFEQRKTLEKITNNLIAIFYKNPNIPSYAYYCNDGSGKYLWRELIKDTELNQTSDIYNRTYANGAVYINNNINFYVRRQDPFGIYGLKYTDVAAGDENEININDLIVNGISKELPDVDYKTQNNYSICEN